MLHVSSSLGSDRWASWHEVPGSPTRRILPGCSKLLLVSHLHSIVRSESCRSSSAHHFLVPPAPSHQLQDVDGRARPDHPIAMNHDLVRAGSSVCLLPANLLQDEVDRPGTPHAGVLATLCIRLVRAALDAACGEVIGVWKTA